MYLSEHTHTTGSLPPHSKVKVTKRLKRFLTERTREKDKGREKEKREDVCGAAHSDVDGSVQFLTFP